MISLVGMIWGVFAGLVGAYGGYVFAKRTSIRDWNDGCCKKCGEKWKYLNQDMYGCEYECSNNHSLPVSWLFMQNKPFGE